MNNFPNNNNLPPQFNTPINPNPQFKPINPINTGQIPQMNQGVAGQQPLPFRPQINPPPQGQAGPIQGQQMGIGINPSPTQQPGIMPGQPNRIGIPQGGFPPGGIPAGAIAPGGFAPGRIPGANPSGVIPQGGIQPGGIQPGGIQPGGIRPGPPQQQGMGLMGGILKPVEHSIQAKEMLDLTRDPEQIIQEIIKFINNPQENQISNIVNGVIQLSRDNIDLQLSYVSSRYCSITGKNFESDEEILVVQNQTPVYGSADLEFYKFDGLFFNIHEFISRIVVNGILDYSIDEIDIQLWNGKVKRFCFDTDTLHKLFGGEEGLQKKFGVQFYQYYFFFLEHTVILIIFPIFALYYHQNFLKEQN